ncbi:MAG: hypothetical protein RR297_03715 [Clostridia bacterium]
MSISLGELLKSLAANDIRYTTLKLQNGRILLITEDAGRIFGPYTNEATSVGMSWVSEHLRTPESFHAFLVDHHWNIGGDRVWIAPEFPFFTKDRNRFNETYTVQGSIDPGHYHFCSNTKERVVLKADLYAELYEHIYPRKTFHMQRTVTPSGNPLQGAYEYSSYMNDVSFCGFDQTINLEDTSPEYPMQLEIWNLFQVRSGGVFLLPYLGNTFEFVDYYTPSMGKVLQVEPGYAKIKVASCGEHKIGAKAFNTFGRIGYLQEIGNDEWQLLIRNYYNDPSTSYIKEPSDQPGKTGCSLFVYMNDTRGDGFAELETAGRTFQAPNQIRSTLTLNYWFFSSSLHKLKDIIRCLLNINYVE